MLVDYLTRIETIHCLPFSYYIHAHTTYTPGTSRKLFKNDGTLKIKGWHLHLI